jgi:peptidoglycan hydrolase-like protein with peptidoglycan-binding domain
VTVRINEDIQHILKWAGKKYGWQCDPGEIDGVIGSTTETAINTYKKQYQLAFNKGNVGSGDFWSITFDLYQQEIASLLDVEISELDQEYRKSISWDSDVFSVGCGEAWPVDHKKIDNRHSQSDRRVEILLIDPDDSITLSCTTGSCEGENCPIYGNDEEGNPRCSRSRLSMGDFVPSGPESSDTTRHRISLQLLSPNYFPLANLSCTLNGSDKQESDCDGYVEWPSCADYNNMVTISSGAGSVQIEVPWITNSDPSHTVLLMNAGKITGSDSSVYGIQIRLKGLGHDCGTIDGVAGPKTAEALRQFQKDNDLDESGIADEGTQILLSLKFGA